MLTRKSDSLKSYGTFHPILPYLRRSCTTAWKNANVYTSGLKRLCGHAASSASSTFEYVCLIFSLSPFGGSVTTFNDICKIERGKLSDGSVVIQSLNSLCGFISSIFSRMPSSFICSHLQSK